MKSSHLILLSGLILFLLTSCAPTYIPNALHVPLFYEKGEVEANISTGSNQVDAQVAIALTDHLAIMSNFAWADFEGPTEPEFSQHQLAEFAIGTFFPIGNSGSFEVYGGYGRGKGNSTDEGLISNNSTYISAEGSYSRIFLQTNIGLNTDFLETGFGLRGSQVSFSNYTQNGTVFSNPPSAFFVEPALFLRMGGGDGENWNIKGFMAVGLSAPLKEVIEFDHQGLFFNLGLLFRFNKFYY